MGKSKLEWGEDGEWMLMEDRDCSSISDLRVIGEMLELAEESLFTSMPRNA